MQGNNDSTHDKGFALVQELQRMLGKNATFWPKGSTHYRSFV